MLTIRWKELYPYVTQSVLLESNSKFTSIPKPHFFAINREQFDFVEPRLTNKCHDPRWVEKGGKPVCGRGVSEGGVRVRVPHRLDLDQIFTIYVGRFGPSLADVGL
ncbi:hypothetical protein OSB04_007630 [Centaurea solstitialis]|uniref:Uncharacterized protein n=1 Tax=Centaurea solstitialis TaxID=347529 RepID=A0AA38TK84_9ASTR|nr:hypothetical protein OSB04_007630 [Centaurea solstitialis]